MSFVEQSLRWISEYLRPYPGADKTKPRPGSGDGSGFPGFAKLAAASAVFGLIAGPALAFDEPPVNLGLTSFYDAAPPNGPGLYLNNYTQIYSAGRLNDGNGRKLPLPEQDLTLVVNITQFAYIGPEKFGPGAFGFDLLIPVVPIATVEDGLGGAALKSQNGLGDIVFGPLYQFDPILRPDGSPLLSQRIEFDFIAPTGDYSPALAVNPGSNFWTLNPYYALTYFATPDLAISSRLHYVYNFNNTNPSLGFGPDARFTRAGQAFHVNFSAEYKVLPNLFLGFNSYFFQQLTDTKLNGIDVPGRKERVLGIGPGILYGFDKETSLFVNAYYETLAENRPQGQRYVVRFVKHF